MTMTNDSKSSSNSQALIKSTPKRKTQPSSKSIKKLVKQELLRQVETKYQWDAIASNGDGIVDQSRAVTCYRIARGDRQNERNGAQILPVGIRVDYHLANTVQNQMRVKIAVVELNGHRTLNAGNAGTYILDNLFLGEGVPDAIPVDSTGLLQCERMTAPLNTELFKIHAVKTFEMGKPNAVGVLPSYQAGSFYVKLKDSTPIHYTSSTSNRPGDPDVSRNIVVLYWGGSPDVRTNVGVGNYNARVNIRQYYKDP